MPKDKDTFFDDDEEETEEKGAPRNPAPPETKPKSEEPAKQMPPAKDEPDWKAKYEAAEAEKLDNRYLDELLRMDDTLEGDTLDDIEGGKRYRELRGMGLSARTAYAALQEEIAETSSGNREKLNTGKQHVSATTFRSTSPKSRMDKSTKAIVDDVLDGLSNEQKEELYRRVSG